VNIVCISEKNIVCPSEIMIHCVYLENDILCLSAEKDLLFIREEDMVIISE
jgi:hypothetical protein